MKTISTITILLLFIFSAIGQSEKECDEILQKTVYYNLDSFPSKLRENMQTFNSCYLDSIDIQIFGTTPSAVFLLKDSSKKGPFTFGDLLENYDDFRKTSDYDNLKFIFEFTAGFEEMKVSPENWEKLKPKFQMFLPNEKEEKKFEKLVLSGEYSDLTFKEFFEILTKQQKETETTLPTSQAGDTINLEEVLALSKSKNKNILLYFTGHGCVNAQKMDKPILSDPILKARIENEFIFIILIVNDRRKLAKEIKTKNGRTLRSVGNKNAHFQKTKFGKISQPYFVILDSEGNKLSDIGYSYYNDFVQFLDEGTKE